MFVGIVPFYSPGGLGQDQAYNPSRPSHAAFSTLRGQHHLVHIFCTTSTILAIELDVRSFARYELKCDPRVSALCRVSWMR